MTVWPFHPGSPACISTSSVGWKSPSEPSLAGRSFSIEGLTTALRSTGGVGRNGILLTFAPSFPAAWKIAKPQASKSSFPVVAIIFTCSWAGLMEDSLLVDLILSRKTHPIPAPIIATIPESFREVRRKLPYTQQVVSLPSDQSYPDRRRLDSWGLSGLARSKATGWLSPAPVSVRPSRLSSTRWSDCGYASPPLAAAGSCASSTEAREVSREGWSCVFSGREEMKQPGRTEGEETNHSY